MLDLAAARRMMVDCQVRTSDVTDQRLIAAMLEVPRERFLPAGKAGLAYLDRDIAAGDASTGAMARSLIKPMTFAKMIQAASPAPDEKLLDVGCASGYSTAVLAKLAGSVVALEEDAALARRAQDLLGGPNIDVVMGPLAKGWAAQAPYDVIVLEGAIEVPPEALCQQLSDGGRLVCVLGTGPASKAMLYRRDIGQGTNRGPGEISGRPIFDATAPLLPGFAAIPSFVF